MRRVLIALAGLTVVLAGCTGVPNSSSPQTIKAVPLGPGNDSPTISPGPNVAPRELVIDFLRANAIEPGRHTSARTFLTTGARSRWSDTTATIVSDITYGTYTPDKPVTVSARIVGQLSASGVYTPSLDGSGDGGQRTQFEYGIDLSGGQYRIDSLPKGLLLTTDQFQSTYNQRPLYFYDSAGRYLVPDLRWSALSGGTLEQWLIDQLAAGPRQDLQNAVNSDTLPTQATLRTLTVKRGTTTTIEIRGAQQLDSAGRDQLAAQISYTLNGAAAGGLLSITDGGRAVRIPAVNSSVFTITSFGDAGGPITPQPDVYYLRNGKIMSDTGRSLSGKANAGFYLSSVGLERTGSSNTLNVAGVADGGSASRLVVGTQESGLHPTPVSGALSRPAWVPGTDEVWVGAGRSLYRTTVVDGRPTTPTRVSIPATASGAQILALRFSPEGSRLAMVLGVPGGARQLMVGSVARNGAQVRIDDLSRLSPAGVVVTDVAWIDSVKLFAIGYESGSGDTRVFETNVDGSFWNPRTFSLPDPPDSVTFAAGQLAWVSSGGFVWIQNGPSSWESPGTASQTPGYAPVYLE